MKNIIRNNRILTGALAGYTFGYVLGYFVRMYAA